jgi:hypothetical protein
VTPHQVIAVAVRLFAIWLIIGVLRTAPQFYREFARVGDSTANAIVIGVSVLAVLLILFLWFFPKTVARNLLDAKPFNPQELAAPDTWFAMGCALIGLWLIVPAIAALIYNLFLLYLAQRDSRIDMTGMGPGWIFYLVELVFGVWLLLGARGARKLFWWARNAG